MKEIKSSKDVKIINIKDLPDSPTNDLYLITPASQAEIEAGNFIEIFGLKISSNPKKHAVIKDVKP